MLRFSLKHFVFVLPLLVAVCVAWVLASARNERKRAVDRFDRSVAQNSAVNIGLLLESIGEVATKKKLFKAAQANSNIVYDGGVRVAQIIPKGGYSERADQYNLAGIGAASGANVWTPPDGAYFSTLRFDGDTLLVTLHGNLQLGSSNRLIPVESPETYSLSWPSDEPNPPKHYLQGMIEKRQLQD